MSNVRYIYSPGLGRNLEVETIDTDIASKRKKKRGHAFIILPLAEIARAASIIEPITLVWLALQYERWRQKSNTVRLPTTRLRSWGLDRWKWGRALVRIERAGLARIDRRGRGRAARVTLTAL